MEIWRVGRHQKIISSILDEIAQGWRGGATGTIATTLPSGELLGNFLEPGRYSAQLLPGIAEFRDEESYSRLRAMRS